MNRTTTVTRAAMALVALAALCTPAACSTSTGQEVTKAEPATQSQPRPGTVPSTQDSINAVELAAFAPSPQEGAAFWAAGETLDIFPWESLEQLRDYSDISVVGVLSAVSSRGGGTDPMKLGAVVLDVEVVRVLGGMQQPVLNGHGPNTITVLVSMPATMVEGWTKQISASISDTRYLLFLSQAETERGPIEGEYDIGDFTYVFAESNVDGTIRGDPEKFVIAGGVSPVGRSFVAEAERLTRPVGEPQTSPPKVPDDIAQILEEAGKPVPSSLPEPTVTEK